MIWVTKEKINFIADTVHGSIQLSGIEKKTISSPIFNRLHNISQNSTAYMTFPANRTKRFEHSIGTMYLAGKMFFYSIANAEDEIRTSFFETYMDIVDNRIKYILENDSKMYKAELGDKNLNYEKLKNYRTPAFLDKLKCLNEWIPANVKDEEKYIYLVLMQSVLLGGLLHDVGHPPFSHITESAMKAVWKEVGEKDRRNQREKEYFEVLERYFKDNGELHEQIGNAITERLLSSILNPMPGGRKAYEDYLPEQMYLIMVKETTEAILNERNAFFKSIHGLISSSLDADRLDYVVRDVMNSGLNEGKIEYDRLLPTMKLLKDETVDEYLFAPSIKVVSTLEDFFNRRWNLYKKIIFHHRVIKTDYLLRDCIEELIHLYLGKDEIGEKMSAGVLPYNISGLWLAVKKVPSDEDFFYQLIQWDDSWLMVVLKKEFYSMPENGEESLKDKLNELLANQKYYYSVVKNVEMFNEIEQAAISEINKEIGNLKSLLEQVEKSSEEVEKKLGIVIDPFCNDLKNMFLILESDKEQNFQRKGFMLGRISRLIFENYMPEEKAFEKLVRQAVQDECRNMNGIYDVVIEFKNLKSGIQESCQ